jgi:hypothetical protein
MTLPERASDQRRRQIFDDDTGASPRVRTNRSEDTPAQPDTGMHEDIWVRSFLARLAGLVRDIGRSRKQD